MIKKIIANSALRVSGFIFPIILLPILSRTIGASGIGLTSLFENTVRYGLIIVSFSFPITTILKINRAKSNEEKSEIISQHISIAGLLSILVFLSFFVILFCFTAYFNNYAMICGFLFISQAFSFDYIFTALGDFKYLALRTVLIRSFSIIAVYFLIKDKNDILLYLVIMTITGVVTMVLNLRYLNRYFDLKLNLKYLIIQEQRNYYFIILLTSIYNSLDLLLLSFFSGEVEVGFYSSGLRLAKVPMALIGAITTVLFTEFSKSLSLNDLKEKLSSTIPLILSFSLVCSFVLFFNSEFLVMSFLGPHFSPVIILVKVSSLLLPILTLTQVFSSQFLPILQKEDLLLKILFYGALVYIVTSILLMNYFEAIGGVLSLLITELFILSCSLFFFKKLSGVSIISFFERELIGLFIILFMTEYLFYQVKLSDNPIKLFLKLALESIMIYYFLPSSKGLFKYLLKSRHV